MGTSRIGTAFLSPERALPPQVLAQGGEIDQSLLVEVLNTIPGMVAVLNRNRQIVFCNDACSSAGGLLRKEDALGMRPGELLRCVHAPDTPGGCGTGESCRHCGLAQAVVAGQKGLTHSGECLLQCRGSDGDTPSEYAVKVRPLTQFDSDMVICSISDISHQKRREALEHTFFHDIMNRAVAVQSASSLLSDEGISPEIRGHVIGLLSQSSQALVDEIRTQRILLAAEKGALGVDKTACDSLQTLRGAVASCEALGYAEKIPIVILPDAVSEIFVTDVTLLGRILINLLKNALEAASPGTAVTAACTLAGAGRILFSVHNDSIMPAGVRAHIFKRSFSTKGAGRGLGTYSVRLLTEGYLGGRAWFDSTLGGTTFFVEFDRV